MPLEKKEKNCPRDKLTAVVNIYSRKIRGLKEVLAYFYLPADPYINWDPKSAMFN